MSLTESSQVGTAHTSRTRRGTFQQAPVLSRTRLVWRRDGLANAGFIAAIVGLAAAIFATILWLTPAPIPAQYGGYPPCLTEDAAGPCYWDADTMGNGIGQSFTVDADGTVTYVQEGR